MFALNPSDKESFIKELDEVTEFVKKHMAGVMQKRVQKCKEEGITAKYEIIVGYSASEIISAIQKYKIDLVVMAKKRKFSENKILNLGDVTRLVLEEANCPILIIDSENKQYD
jgi:nucleotide-binding universal stress UspA family protein